MEKRTDRPERPDRPQRPVAGRRFYDEQNRPVTPKQFRPDRDAADGFAEEARARPRGRGGSDNRDDQPDRGSA
ncbi:hypothetical protein, partial [Hymenobacter coccineus]|uniref:hypothetical protein n=1 Tax=Hymenobacter coccineus TaxID=1908235 RepID=UPI001955AB24